MASYFDEHDFSRNENEQSSSSNALEDVDIMRIVRMILQQDVDLISNGDLFGVADSLAPPASKSSVAKLDCRKPTEDEIEDDENCPVCLVKYTEEDDIIIMPCEHSYHNTCLLPWLKKTNSCAVCRYELPTDNPQYEEQKKRKQEEKLRQERVDELHNSMFG